MVAVEIIERMDQEIELKDNKINVLVKQSKNVNHHNERIVQNLLNKNPVIRNNIEERAKRSLLDTLSYK